MCIEQRKAFEAVIECIDAQAAEVEKGKSLYSIHHVDIPTIF